MGSTEGGILSADGTAKTWFEELEAATETVGDSAARALDGVSSLDTRVTTAETDITARPPSTQLAAPEGAAGVGTTDGGCVEEALSGLGRAAKMGDTECRERVCSDC